MARVFVRTSTQYINIGSAVLTGVPISMACWFNSDDITVAQTLLSISDVGANNQYVKLAAAGDAGGDPISAVTQTAGGAAEAVSSTGYSADTWHHACAIFAATNDRRAFIDGGSKGTNTNDRTLSGLDATTIGSFIILVGTQEAMSGRIAEAAIWNIALTDEEVAVLANGYSPLLVRPQNLVFYAPLVREIQDVVGGVTLTNTGTTVGDHPRMIYPAPPLTVAAPVPGFLQVTASPAVVSVAAVTPGTGLGITPALLRVVAIGPGAWLAVPPAVVSVGAMTPGIGLGVLPVAVSVVAVTPGTGLGTDPAVVSVVAVAPVVGVVVDAAVVRLIAVTPTIDVGGVLASPAIVSISGVAPKVLGWVDYGPVKRLVDVAHYQGELYFFEVTLRTSDAAAPAHARLYNVTDGVPVAGSELTTTSLVGSRLRSGLLTLSGSKEYRVQLSAEGL